MFACTRTRSGDARCSCMHKLQTQIKSSASRNDKTSHLGVCFAFSPVALSACEIWPLTMQCTRKVYILAEMQPNVPVSPWRTGRHKGHKFVTSKSVYSCLVENFTNCFWRSTNTKTRCHRTVCNDEPNHDIRVFHAWGPGPTKSHPLACIFGMFTMCGREFTQSQRTQH